MANNGKYAKPSASFAPVLLRVAFVLLCLLMVSMYLMGGLLAKYTANGAGSDGARVAKFDVKVTFCEGDEVITGITADLKYNENGVYTITVKNNSEVAISYDIIVKDIEVTHVTDAGNAQAFATDGITVQLDEVGFNLFDRNTASFVNSHSFDDVGTIAPNADTANSHSLQFVVNWDEFLSSVKGSHANLTITFNVVVDVTQVD